MSKARQRVSNDTKIGIGLQEVSVVEVHFFIVKNNNSGEGEAK